MAAAVRRSPRRAARTSTRCARRSRPAATSSTAAARVKVLALDYGSARTGVAVSDPTGTVARPVTTVERAATDAGFAKLLAVIAAEEPELVVVGLPLTLRGEHGEQARETDCVRRASPRRGRRAGRDLRRALHLRARRRRRRARRGAPARELSRVAERPAMMPVPKRRGPSPEQIRRRRSDRVRQPSSSRWLRSSSRSWSRSRTCTARMPLPPPPPAPKPFRIVFPEGFTRAQMAVRVRDVAKIARRKSDKPVKLNSARYRARDPARVAPVLQAARAEEPRGVPVPGDLRLPRPDDDARSSRRISCRRSARTGAR